MHSLYQQIAQDGAVRARTFLSLLTMEITLLYRLGGLTAILMGLSASMVGNQLHRVSRRPSGPDGSPGPASE